MNDQLNIIEIIGLKNETLNFEAMLSLNNSLIIKNCHNIKIIIKSKINKITVEKSNNILVNVYKLISGLEIANSNTILISSEQNESTDYIPVIDIYKSSIYLVGSINLYSNIKIISSQSELFQLETTIKSNN
jgi:hypothetical protein